MPNNIFVVLMICLYVSVANAMEQRLFATDAADFDAYGSAVAVDGVIAIVGAPNQNDLGTNSGAAYVLTRDPDGNWTQQVKLTAADSVAYDNFGASVAVSGDIALVGAPGADDAGDDSGAVYVFTRDINNSWNEQARLTASDGTYLAAFGASVAISGTTAIVGAKSATENQLVTGAAYVFFYDGSNWNQQAKLVASDGAQWDNFGRSVAVSVDTAIVGASGATENGFASGAAYVYSRASNVWSEQAKLIPDVGAAGDMFGNSVSISGDDILIGSYHDDAGGIDAGAAYIYTRTGSVWNEPARLSATVAAANDNFAASVAIENDVAVIGASNFAGSGSRQGIAYIFERVASSWSQVDTHTASDAVNDQRFGVSVAVSAGALLIGANGHATNGVNSGATYIYTDLPNLSMDDITVNEGAGTATFMVSLDAVPAAPVTVDIVTANGTAVAGSDYIAAGPTTLTFSVNDSLTQPFVVTIIDDNDIESNEIFTATLSNESGANISAPIGTATITDNDHPNLSMDDVTVNEDAGTATFTVSLDAVPAASVTVDIVTENGTAVAGSDYIAAGPTTLTFAVNDPLTQTFVVTITDDNDFESNEVFTATLSNESGANISVATGSATILDNDTNTLSCGTPSFSSATEQAIFIWQDCPTGDWFMRATAGGSSVHYLGNITSTAAFASVAGFSMEGTDVVDSTTDPLAIHYDLRMSNAGVDGIDFHFTPGTDTCFDASLPIGISVYVGASRQSVTLPLDLDTLGNCSVVPTLSINNVTVTEGTDPTAEFIVSLSIASGSPVTVDYATVDGTAIGGSDYTMDSGTLTFNANETSKTISLVIQDDAIPEGEENFTVSLSNASVLIADASGSATILDNETNTLSCGTPSFSSATEQAIFIWQDCPTGDWFMRATAGGSSVHYLGQITSTTAFASVAGFSLEGNDIVDNTTDPLAIHYNLRMGNAGVDGIDFNFTPGTDTCFDASLPIGISVYVGASRQSVTLPLDLDTLGNCSVVPTLSINNVTVTEGTDPTAEFIVSLSLASDSPVTVGYATVDGTAIGGSDYTMDSGTLTFNANETSKTISLVIQDDAIPEGEENFTVSLSNASVLITDASGSATILDNDSNNGSTDIVTINRASYDSADNKLWIKATSDAPSGSAIITATAITNGVETVLGQVGWKASKGFYQQTFKNLTSIPDTIKLTSHLGGIATAAIEGGGDGGGGSNADTLTIIKGVYYPASDKLWIKANSDASPPGSATITAVMVINGVETVLGQVGWKSDKNAYQQSFTNIAVEPDSVILNSNLGGTVTEPVSVQ